MAMQDVIQVFGRLSGAIDALAALGARLSVADDSSFPPEVLAALDEVLAAAGVPDLFAVRVDGHVAAELGLPGKPDPAVFLEAARRLGAGPDRTAVVEDALAGVQAGRRGGFALVVGVDRTGHADELRAAGADVVVGDLAELTVEGAAVR